MKLKIPVLCILVLTLLSGCHLNPEQTPSGTQDPDATVITGGAESQPPDASDPTGPNSPTITPDDPNNPAIYDTYHSGKPYVQWGSPCSVAVELESGKSVALSGNLPESSLGLLKRKYLWIGNTDDLNTSFMVGYFDASQHSIQSPSSFFADVSDNFTEQYYRLFQIGAKDAIIDIRDSVSVTKHGVRMCRYVGAAKWTSSSSPIEDSFVAYVFQEPSGDYLCCLFQCKKKGWALTQEIAENFINTLSWEVFNAGSQ